MRQNNNSGRRSRGRGNNNGNRRPANRMQVFDSNGPDIRIRGTAHQVCDKYLALAKDAIAADDRVIAETYYQYAEHYQRIINNWNEDVAENDKPSYSKQNEKESKSSSNDTDLSLPATILGDEINGNLSTSKSETKKELEDA